MRLSQFIDRDPANRRKTPKAARPSIALHGAFLPLLALWGALLLGLTVMVLPQMMLDRFSALSGGALEGDGGRLICAGVAAVFGAALAFVIGGAIRSGALRKDSGRPIVAAVQGRKVRPIDPAIDLGSASLDAPLEKIPFAREHADADFEDEDEDAFDEDAPRSQFGSVPWLDNPATAKPAAAEVTAEDAPEADQPALANPASPIVDKPKKRTAPARIGGPGGTGSWGLKQFNPATVPVSKPEPQPELEAPLELDLSEFAELPGRNAVWVEGEAGAPRRQTARPPASALEKLRQKPADQLSLVEMVERFAGALHEHQQTERTRRSPGGTGSDAALAEALRALTLFTDAGFDQAGAHAAADQLSQTERELRSALSKLQNLRGAA